MKNPNPIGTSTWILNRHKGFTLVELLVVITIIAVLAGVLFALTQKIRAKAYQAKALSPLSQTSMACMAYSLDNNGDILTVNFQGSPRMNGKWVTGSFWGALAPNIFTSLELKNDTTSSKALNRAVTSLFGTKDRLMKGTFQGETHGAIADTCAFVPFAFNANVADWNKYLKVSQYNDPSKTLYMTYGWSSFTKKDGDKYTPLPKTRPERTNNIDWFPSNTAAFVFLDGHVELLSAPVADRLYSTKPPN